MRNILTLVSAVLLLALHAPLGGAISGDQETSAVDAAPAGIQLNFKDAPLDAVLQHLSQVAGLVIVAEVPLDGRVTVVSRQPLDVEETVTLLGSVLRAHGLTAIRMGRMLKIIPLADAKVENIPVQSGSDPEKITPSDQVVTQVIPLRSVDAEKLAEDLKPLLPAYAELSANASSNALILTDTGVNVRRIVEIVSALDGHGSSVVEVKVFPLSYADATSAAKLINEVFKVEEPAARQQQLRLSGPAARMFAGRGGDQAGGDDQAYRPQSTIAAADQRTNTVVVSGPADTLEIVEDVIRQIDSNPADEQAVMVYRLKNAKAKNLETVFNTLFAQSEVDTSALRTGGAGGLSQRAQQFRQLAEAMTQQQSGGQQSEAAADLAGQVQVVADEDTNSLLIMAAPRHFGQIREILDQLDTPVPQVLIKVLVAEVTHGKDFDLGVEFSGLSLGGSGRSHSYSTSFGIPTSPQGLRYTLIDEDVTVAVSLLEQVGKLEILSRPYILASDNQEATITVGQEVPFITNTRTTETGQTVNTIQYEDIGIILKVTPHINADGLVIMDVVPEISSITGDTVPISEVVAAQVFTKRSAASRVAIQDGQTIVIGGLVEDRKVKNVKRVPVLGAIPLIGALFRRTVSETDKTELLIFITPHVANEPAAIADISADEEKGMKLTPDAIRPGAFDEHMKGLRGGTKVEREPQLDDPRTGGAVDRLEFAPDSDWAGRPFADLQFSADFSAGTSDHNGRLMGGTECTHLVAHGGRLYAAMGYLNADQRAGPVTGPQVLVKSAFDVPWEVDASFGWPGGRLTSLRSITLTTDRRGRPLDQALALLIAAMSGTVDPGKITVLVRDDESGRWQESQLAGTTRSGTAEVGAVFDHVDRVTGVHHVFAAADGRIFRGGFDPAAPGAIRWVRKPEHKGFNGGVTAAAEIEGVAYVVADPVAGEPGNGGLFRRIDGRRPRWEWIAEWGQPPVLEGQSWLRGLTAVADPAALDRQALLGARDLAGAIEIIRPSENHRVAQELDVRGLLGRVWQVPRGRRIVSIIASSGMVAAAHPDTGDRVHLIGLGAGYAPLVPGDEMGTSAWYLVRSEDGSYAMGRVFDPQHPAPAAAGGLRTVRAICPSPFPEDGGRLWYFGGFDASDGPHLNTAWIYRAVLPSSSDRVAGSA